MFSFKVNHLLFLFIFQGYDCQRRIQGGDVVKGQKRYMVYLLKASVSPRNYEGWLCGGALVTREFIVTSAACVTDVAHLYAIAGYNKYVSDTEMYKDPCTKDRKKKVIQTCTHKAYNLTYEMPQVWSDIDIAVVKVESPYDFNDNSYAHLCSYAPVSIEVNYDLKYQEPGTDAMVLGWGHREKWREDMDLENYNMQQLYYAPVLIEDKAKCKAEYKVYDGMGEVIDRYMICTNVEGNINDDGKTILKSEPTAQGCVPNKLQKLRGEVFCDAAMADDDIVLVENSRKRITNFTSNAEQNSKYLNIELKRNIVDSNVRPNSSLINEMNKTILNSRRHNTKRSGICQNDHGGPLITWVGTREVLIGVASAFKVSESLDCIGPYLFTSTQCNGVFLDCILRTDPESIRRANCEDVLLSKGFKLIENFISWKDHPDGPADNERNITTHTKEEKKEKAEDHNNTGLNNTNITKTNLNITHDTENSNLTETTKDANLINTLSLNVTNSSTANVKQFASVILTSVTSTNLTDEIKDPSTNNVTNASLTNIKNTTTTKLIKNATTNLINTTTPIIAIEDTTITILIKNTSSNIVNVSNLITTTTPTNVSLTDIMETTTTNTLENTTTNPVNTTTPINVSLTDINKITTTNLVNAITATNVSITLISSTTRNLINTTTSIQHFFYA